MAKGYINDTTMTDIANAIRAKTETSDPILPSEMADIILAIEAAGGKAAMGSWTTSGSTKTVNHGLGKTPNFVGVFAGGKIMNSPSSGYYICASLYIDLTGTNIGGTYKKTGLRTSGNPLTYAVFCGNVTDTKIEFNGEYSGIDSACKYKYDLTYYWIAGVI